MVNPSSSNDNRGNRKRNPDLSKTQAELLQAILAERSYPWMPSPASEGQKTDYEVELETAGQSLEISDEESSKGWQCLSVQLDRMWGTPDVDVLAMLRQKFAARLPEAVLARISDRAQQVAASAEPMVTQMIACVKDNATQIAEADLQVMARPMAFAMRSSGAEELVDATAAAVRQTDWESLSALEQAKLSLAAARYALAQIDSQV